MVRCKHGKLKSPVRNKKTGKMRRCKLPKKTKKGRSQDRKKRSGEHHEVRYREERQKHPKPVKGRCPKGFHKSKRDIKGHKKGTICVRSK